MTGIKKILFSTNMQEEDNLIYLLDKIGALHETGLEEVVLMHSIGKSVDALNIPHIKIKTTYEKNITPLKIIHTARTENTSIILVNLCRYTRWAYGKSLIRDLINKSKFPILFIIQENGDPETIIPHELFSHVIYATNWSEESEKAIQMLFTIKKIIREMEIVNVINKKLTIKDMRDLKEKIAIVRKKCLDTQIDAEAHIYAGSTAVEILTAAKDYKGTVIIVGGSKEKSSFRRFLTGSLLYKLIENTTLPVLVIP